MLKQIKYFKKRFPSDKMGIISLLLYQWPDIAKEYNLQIDMKPIDIANAVNKLCGMNVIPKNNINKVFKTCSERSNGVVTILDNGCIEFDMEKRNNTTLEDFINMSTKQPKKMAKLTKKFFNEINESILPPANQMPIPEDQIGIYDMAIVMFERLHFLQLINPCKNVRAICHPDGILEIIYGYDKGEINEQK